MSDVVIRAEGLGKKYLIGHESQQERYTALRDVLGRTVKGFARSARDMLRGRQLIAGNEVEEFWALKDVISRSSAAKWSASSAATAPANRRC